MWTPCGIVMALVARHRQAERARLHAVAHEVLHLLDLGVGGGALLAFVAHHVIAHRGVADQIADIDAQVMIELVEILRHRFPAEFEGAQHLHRDRFDIGEELRQPLLLALAHRRQGQRAIAEDHRGGAVVAGKRAQRVPGDLRVVMAMIVDKAGGDDAAGGVDRALGRAAQLADLGDLAVFDADVALERRHARAVDDAPVLDQQIIRHRYTFLLSEAGRALFRQKCSTPRRSAALREFDGMLFAARMADGGARWSAAADAHPAPIRPKIAGFATDHLAINMNPPNKLNCHPNPLNPSPTKVNCHRNATHRNATVTQLT